MVRRVLQLFYREVRGLHQAAYILALFAFTSQILALVRDRLLAHTFGAGIELDIYYTAFKIPDLLYVLFASVLSVYVLLPFVTKAKEETDVAAGRAILSQMFTLFLGVYVLVAAFVMISAPVLVPKLFPGYFGADLQELILLLRILLLQPLLLGLSSLVGVVTQLGHRFVLYAISPLLYNIGIIIGVAAFYPMFGLPGLAYGVVLGALGHLLIQLPFLLTSEWRFTLAPRICWTTIGRVIKVAIPRALTLSLNQIVFLWFVGLASTMAVGSMSVFQFAFNVQSVPLAIIGMSYSVAAFPVLADLLSRKELDSFRVHVMTALRHIIFWSVPMIALVVVLRAQIVRVLLGSGSFDWSDTRLTAAVLAIFIISLVAQAALLLLVRAFYAGGHTIIPLIVTLFGAGSTVVVTMIALQYYHASPAFQHMLESFARLDGVVGTEVLVLPIGYTLGMIVQFLIMLVVLARTFALPIWWLGRKFFEAVMAALAGGTAAYIALAFVVEGVNQETFIGIFLQGAVATVVGVGAIILTYATLSSRELKEIHHSFRLKLFKTDVIAPQENVL